MLMLFASLSRHVGPADRLHAALPRSGSHRQVVRIDRGVRFTDHFDRTRRVPDDAVRDAAQHHPLPAVTCVRSHHDQVCRPLRGHRDDRAPGLAFDDIRRRLNPRLSGADRGADQLAALALKFLVGGDYRVGAAGPAANVSDAGWSCGHATTWTTRTSVSPGGTGLITAAMAAAERVELSMGTSTLMAASSQEEGTTRARMWTSSMRRNTRRRGYFNSDPKCGLFPMPAGNSPPAAILPGASSRNT